MQAQRKVVNKRVNKELRKDNRRKNETIEKPWAGWLKNSARRRRREMPMTLTDKQVNGLIHKVESMPSYSHLEPSQDRLLRLRDSALIATNWVWFKRGSEILNLRFGDVSIIDNEVSISLFIKKKQKRFKVCRRCKDETKNAMKANYCKVCGKNIERVEVVEVGVKPEKKVKRKNLANPFCAFLVRWVRELEQLGAEPDWWLFPRWHYYTGNFLFKASKTLTVPRYNQILQRLDPTMSSCMFRYGGAEKWLQLGYTPYEVKEIGDWESSRMPERYAERKGFTPSQKRFAEDNRTI